MNNFFSRLINKSKSSSYIKINPILIFVFVILILFFMLITHYIFVSSKSKEALAILGQIESNEDRIDIIEVRNKNTAKVKSQIVYISERVLDFTTVRKTNDKLEKSEIRVVQKGKFGKEQVYIKEVYENNELIEKDIISNYIIKAPSAEIIEIGTKGISPTDVADNSYTTNTYDSRKAKVFSNLGFGMDLRQPSGLTYKDFQKIISNEERDRNNVFADNIETFYAIEKKYNINGIFVMALAIHESGWGTSSISKNKKNLFGYGAYDSSPYSSSFSFDCYAEGIETVSKALVKYYLNTSGTPIYDGQVASGDYYNGPNLAGVNVRYATDSQWGFKVFTIMEYLYGRM